jgi:hypothetical protein
MLLSCGGVYLGVYGGEEEGVIGSPITLSDAFYKKKRCFNQSIVAGR